MFGDPEATTTAERKETIEEFRVRITLWQEQKLDSIEL